MSEGGFLQWKRQEIDESRGPAASYSNLKKPLPGPPVNMHWVLDTITREWRLEHIMETPESDVVATPVDEQDDEIIEHKVLPSDTFQGICLRYKITPTELRQANGGFSGTNLHLAPNPLRIPSKHQPVVEATAVPVGEESPQTKIQRLCRSCPGLSKSEARCYLELNDWDAKEALLNARDDGF
eukprot:CAMPEP_0117031322 /NCGR_PEP_ID=MMETSP0472-20121206/22528_1 /TAXON_ID=693140 ORGANISM="Tiarina fusus, Strain LIS" /NCGR_SAMPLE_ID=MMETSP0472 /ASSEMBLY_ACC=CAM_ASM_000603 /LENGTH=182 /DNA_ID=CAMNT_0004739627 /DNA_START=95 /DNA_END=643 /DNA_ORIENTATION=+